MTAKATDSLRRRFNGFVERHEVAWELGMAVLAIAFVVIGFAIDGAGPAMRRGLEAADTALTIVFALEFGTRFLAAWDRRAYLRGHWIDLLALLPVLRGVRILRLLRLLRLVRAFAGVFRAASHVERLARHRGLAWLFVTWLAVMVLCSGVLYAAENGVNEAVASPLDALWWGIVTLTTVGYGDVTPITVEGKVAASVLMLLGIALFSAITATVTSFMLAGRSAPASADQVRALADLRREGLLSDAEFEAKRRELVNRL